MVPVKYLPMLAWILSLGSQENLTQVIPECPKEEIAYFAMR